MINSPLQIQQLWQNYR